MAEVNEFNLSYLQKKIDELKEETTQTSEYTIQYLECLRDKYNLMKSIPEDFHLQEIPDIITNKLKDGKLPTEEDLLLIDPFEQFALRSELIFLCGMNLLRDMGGEETQGDSDAPMCDIINCMVEISPAYCGGAYIFMAMLLLTYTIPSPALIENMTRKFGESEDDIKSSSVVFQELSDAILARYVFDNP